MYITTYSKVHFTPLEPEAEQIRMEDIAHAQSLMTRANGHFPEFYSVAQHSIACGKEAIARGYSAKVILACLVHDGSEAYLSDITRPVKGELPKYQEIEKNLQDAIYERFLGESLTKEEEQMVKDVDDTCLYYEFKHYMGEELFDTVPVAYEIQEFKEKNFREVEEELLEMLNTWSAVYSNCTPGYPQ